MPVCSLEEAAARQPVLWLQGSELFVPVFFRNLGVCVRVSVLGQPLVALGWIAVAAPLSWSATVPFAVCAAVQYAKRMPGDALVR